MRWAYPCPGTIEYELELGEGGKWEWSWRPRGGPEMFRKKGDNNNKSSKTLRSLRSLLLFIYCLSQSRQTHEPMKSPSCSPGPGAADCLCARHSKVLTVTLRPHTPTRQLCCLGGTSPTGTPGQNGFGIFSNSISPTLSLSFSLRTTTLCLSSAECSVQSSPAPHPALPPAHPPQTKGERSWKPCTARHGTVDTEYFVPSII